jgi:hypothetical protein
MKTLQRKCMSQLMNILYVIVALMAGSGCASIVAGGPDTVLFKSEPSNAKLTGAYLSWGRAGIAAKMRYAFGNLHPGSKRRPLPDAMPHRRQRPVMTACLL